MLVWYRDTYLKIKKKKKKNQKNPVREDFCHLSKMKDYRAGVY